MARETKVGLLAGLAFIVCFAIILTNRGRQEMQANLGSTSGQRMADRSSSNQSPTRNAAGGRAHVGRRAVSRRTSHTALQPSPVRSINSQQPRSYRGHRIKQAEPLRAEHPNVKKIGQRSKPEDTTFKTNLTGQPQSQVDGNSASRSTPTLQRGGRQSSDHNIRQLELRIAQLTNQLESAKKQSTPAANQPARAPNRTTGSTRNVKGTAQDGFQSKSGSLKYVVAAGDTLSKIAKTYYGHGTKHYVDLIVDANRGVLENPNVVRVGDELFLPGVPVVQIGKASQTLRSGLVQVVAPPRKGNRTNKHGSTPAAWKWYEIKKNDRYISIAREQLGDATRWPEIHELNKEKFSDPSRIRVGVRIKLPTITLANANQEPHR